MQGAGDGDSCPEIGRLSHVSSCIAKRPRTELASLGAPMIGLHVHISGMPSMSLHSLTFTPVIFPLTSVQEHKEDFKDISHCNGSSSVQLILGSMLGWPTFLVPFHIYFTRGSR